MRGVRLPPLYAHRLGRAYGPDSSLQALERTLAAPVEGLETDCCLTADGELVLLHDPPLALGTTPDGLAHERTAAEILPARLGMTQQKHALHRTHPPPTAHVKREITV